MVIEAIDPISPNLITTSVVESSIFRGERKTFTSPILF